MASASNFHVLDGIAVYICHFLLMYKLKNKQAHVADMLATWPTLPWRRPSLVSTLQTQPASRRTRSTTSWAMVVGATSAAGETILRRDPITGLRHWVVAGLKIYLFKGRPPVRTCRSNVIGMPSTTLDLTHRCKYHWEVFKTIINLYLELVFKENCLVSLSRCWTEPWWEVPTTTTTTTTTAAISSPTRSPPTTMPAFSPLWRASTNFLVGEPNIFSFSLSKYQVKAQPLDLTRLQGQLTHPNQPTRPTQPIQQIHLIHKEGVSPTLWLDSAWRLTLRWSKKFCFDIICLAYITNRFSVTLPTQPQGCRSSWLQ